MKILLTSSFYPPHHIGGDAVHVEYLAQALVREGHVVHVMHSLDAYNLKKKEKKTRPKSKVIVHTLSSPLGILEPILNYSFGTQKYTMDSFKKLIKKENFDVVHHHNISLLGYNILKKIKPYINLYTAHDYWLMCHKYSMIKNKEICTKKNCFSCCFKNKKIYQHFRNSSKFKACINDIDNIITPSRFMANVFLRDFNNVKIIHNFIPEMPIIKKRKIKDYFIYAGVLEEHKGILNLTRAFSRLNRKLLIVGTGSLKKDIKKLKTKNIELVGWKKQEELFSLISSAQALIIPSTCLENNPLTALESISLGTPVIGSDSGGIPEIVEKIDKRLVFKKDNINQLRNIILNFDRSKYPNIKNIHQRHFSQKIFLKKYLRLIK